jgi:4-amino-4-deoxy-L-arabinose transferase-like glycosyltransferase
MIGIAGGMMVNFTVNHNWTYGTFLVKIPKRLILIIILFLMIRLAIAASVGAGYDEAYYFSYSTHPDWSYFDHPPFVGFLAGFFPFVTGIVNSVTIRLGAILLFVATTLLFYRLARDYLSPTRAFYATLILNIIPLFLLGSGTFILPDAGLSFFWTASLLFLWKSLKQNKILYWVIAGICTGFALLNKYHGILLIVMTFLMLLYMKPKYLIKPGFYLYTFTALLVFSPVIYWNIKHDFISFAFQGSRAGYSHISLDSFFQGLGGQAGYLTPMIFVTMVYIIFQTFKKGILQKNTQHGFYFFFGGLPVILFNVVGLFEPILPHWTLPGYLVLTIPFSKWLYHSAQNSKIIKSISIFTVVFIFILLMLAVLHTRFGIIPLNKMVEKGWFSQKEVRMDATLDPFGWNAINAYLKENDFTSDKLFLFTHRWFLSGQVELATKGRYSVMCLNEHDPRGFGIWDQKSGNLHRDGLFICTNRYPANPQERYKPYFQSISFIDSLTVERSNKQGKTFYLYCCNHLVKNPNPYQK